MIKHSGLTVSLLAMMIAMNVQAEEQRTRLTIENAFPELGQLELSLGVGFLEFGDNSEGPQVGDANLTRLSGIVRLGLLPNLTALVEVPYDSYDPDFGDEVEELGDIEVGLYLKAFEDIFDYPYIIPYVTYDFGDGEPILLPEGYGDDTFTLGVSIGTVTYDVWTWGLDMSYDINSETENSAVLGGSLYYDFSDRFSMGVEANIRENQTVPNGLGGDNENTPILFMGGMIYQVTKGMQVSVHGGGGKDRQLDNFANLRTTFSF